MALLGIWDCNIGNRSGPYSTAPPAEASACSEALHESLHISPDASESDPWSTAKPTRNNHKALVVTKTILRCI